MYVSAYLSLPFEGKSVADFQPFSVYVFLRTDRMMHEFPLPHSASVYNRTIGRIVFIVSIEWSLKEISLSHIEAKGKEGDGRVDGGKRVQVLYQCEHPGCGEGKISQFLPFSDRREFTALIQEKERETNIHILIWFNSVLLSVYVQ